VSGDERRKLMVVDQLSEEEAVRQALDFYEIRLKPILEPHRNGEQVVVHMEDGDYEVAPTMAEADARLRVRHPQAVFVVMEVGKPLMEWPWGGTNVPFRKR
jgi:hypothetical protein